MKVTKLAYKGHSLPARFSDHGFWLATIGVYHAMGVPFGEGFLPTSDTSGHLWNPTVPTGAISWE